MCDVNGNGHRRYRSALVEPDPARRKIRAVEQHRDGSCLSRVRDRSIRIDSGRDERRAAGDEAGAAAIEEVEQRDGSLIAGGLGRLRSRPTDADVERPRRRDRSCKWSHRVELDAKSCAQHDTHLAEAWS